MFIDLNLYFELRYIAKPACAEQILPFGINEYPSIFKREMSESSDSHVSCKQIALNS